MATPWCGTDDNKLYLQSGQFSSTLVTSQDVSSWSTDPLSLSFNIANTLWASNIPTDTLYLTSGQFSSTILDSQNIGTIDTNPEGIGADSENTVWSGNQAKKLYLQSGQFTSTLKTSQYVGGIDAAVRGVSCDGTNTPWSGQIAGKLYYQSGQFTSTVKDSQFVNGVDLYPMDISWDGTNTPWIGSQSDKLYLQSEQFTSTLITSQSVTTIDAKPRGISTDDFESRVSVICRTITSSLSLDQSILTTVIRERAVENGILFSQFFVVGGARYVKSIEHNLVNDETYYDTETGEYSVVHYGLGHSIDLQVIGNRSVVNDLNLSHEIEYTHIKTTATAKSVTSSLTFGQTIADSRGMDHTIGFSQTIAVEVTHNITSTLAFTQTIGIIKVSNLFVTSTINLQSVLAHTYNESSINVLCTYTPFIGETTDPDAPSPPQLTPPTLIPLSEITLSVEGSSVTLRNPNLGNRDRSGFQRINRETRGGTLIVYSDPVWPKTQTLILEFSGLSETKAQEFLTFIAYSLGQNIELEDWEGNLWGGIIVSPQNPIIREGDCNISVSIEFEGGKLNKESVTSSLGTLSQTIVVNKVIGQTVTSSLSLGHSNIVAYNDYNTLWAGNAGDKLYLQSGQFTSTLLTSLDISGSDTFPTGITWNGTDTAWIGMEFGNLFLQSGRFTATIKESMSWPGEWDYAYGLSWDGDNTSWGGGGNEILYLMSGHFTTTLKDSEDVSSYSALGGISYDGTHAFWAGAGTKLYKMSGQFTSTMLDSEDVTSYNYIVKISVDDINTLWFGASPEKLYLQSGKFSSTILDSENVSGIDSFAAGIEVGQYFKRVNI